jgi:hypothetical protein
LEKTDDTRVEFEEIKRNENRYFRHEILKDRNPLNWITTWRQVQGLMKASETRHKAVVAHERLLTAELALRCYASTHGGGPARLEDLVTNYLSKVPLDPFTGQPLIYKPQSTNWLLYSVGPDGLDDGGRPAGRGVMSKGDLLFNSPW